MIDFFVILEFAAVIFGLLSVYLTTKENLWCWPTGIIMVVLYVIVFFHAKLYSDVIENAIYIPLQIFGWWAWIYGGKKKDDLCVTRLSPVWIVFWIVEIIVVSYLVGYFMANFTDAVVPYLDAFTTVLSLTAQIIMSYKKIENWIMWIIVDILAVYIYSIQGLFMTTGLYILFLILAISGLLSWLKSMKKHKGISKWQKPFPAEQLD
jgi:nicotinamide mononucleotide transporter